MSSAASSVSSSVLRADNFDEWVTREDRLNWYTSVGKLVAELSGCENLKEKKKVIEKFEGKVNKEIKKVKESFCRFSKRQRTQKRQELFLRFMKAAEFKSSFAKMQMFFEKLNPSRFMPVDMLCDSQGLCSMTDNSLALMQDIATRIFLDKDLRRKDNDVYAPFWVINKRGVDGSFDVVNTGYYNKVGTIHEWVTKECVFNSNRFVSELFTTKFKGVDASTLCNSRLKESPLIKSFSATAGVFSFNNGVYDSLRDKFYRFHEIVDDVPLSCKYFHANFRHDLWESLVELETIEAQGNEEETTVDEVEIESVMEESVRTLLGECPMFHQLFKHQMFQLKEIVVICSFLYRLVFFKDEFREEDKNKDLGLFLYGPTKTGKSTLLDVLKAFLLPDDIWTPTNDGKFTNASQVNSRVCVIDELDKNQDQFLDRTNFIYMMNGTQRSVASKGSPAVNLDKRIPTVIGSNFQLFEVYKDEVGAVMRRFFCFPFLNRIMDPIDSYVLKMSATSLDRPVGFSDVEVEVQSEEERPVSRVDLGEDDSDGDMSVAVGQTPGGEVRSRDTGSMRSVNSSMRGTTKQAPSLSTVKAAFFRNEASVGELDVVIMLFLRCYRMTQMLGGPEKYYGQNAFCTHLEFVKRHFPVVDTLIRGEIIVKTGNRGDIVYANKVVEKCKDMSRLPPKKYKVLESILDSVFTSVMRLNGYEYVNHMDHEYFAGVKWAQPFSSD